MATKSSKNHTSPTDMNGNEPEKCQDSAKPNSKIRARKGSKTSTKKVLSRQEKLESVKKANQALMKALELMSQRNQR
jgi:hypothetical protein